MKRIFTFGFLLLALGQGAAEAQQLLSLDSCRAMALRNNKQMGVQQLKQDIAANLRKSARTKYLPQCRLQRVAQSRQGSCEVGTQI